MKKIESRLETTNINALYNFQNGCYARGGEYELRKSELSRTKNGFTLRMGAVCRR